jgi:hypothetical protein
MPIELDWTAPSYTGNTPITGYKVFRNGYYSGIELPDNSANSAEIDFTNNEFLTHGGSNTSYKVHTFTTVGTDTFQVTSGSGNVDLLAVAGGGGGGGSYYSGGGGAGEVYINTGLPISTQSYTITIGSGGTGGTASSNGVNGGDTTALGITVDGGGYGGAGANNSGNSGGSGGGGAELSASGGASTSTGANYYGNAGGSAVQTSNWGTHNAGGSGGGAGGVGGIGDSSLTAGLGGIGIENDFQTGVNQWYGAGGTGNKYGYGNINSAGGWSDRVNGIGGQGGGGWQHTTSDLTKLDGTTNTGSGGGGFDQRQPSYTRAGNGGDGIVVIRYIDDGSITATGGAVTSYTGGYSFSDKSINVITLPIQTGLLNENTPYADGSMYDLDDGCDGDVNTIGSGDYIQDNVPYITLGDTSGNAVSEVRGFSEWDISALSVKKVTKVELELDYYTKGSVNFNIDINPVSLQANGLTNNDLTELNALFVDLDDGTPYLTVNTNGLTGANQLYDLGSNAVTELQNNINNGAGYFTIGYDTAQSCTSSSGDWYRWGADENNSDSNKLIVTYDDSLGSSTTGVIDTGIQNPKLSFTDSNYLTTLMISQLVHGLNLTQ